MSRTVVTRDFAVVIPEEVRRGVPIAPGDIVRGVVKDGLITLVPEGGVESLRGMLEGANIEGFREKARAPR
jgi:AbrB family looped-hinge helix DNA binding protein